MDLMFKVLLSSMWFNKFQDGTGFWKCNEVYDSDDIGVGDSETHDHSLLWIGCYCFGKVLECGVLFLSFSMVYPLGFT